MKNIYKNIKIVGIQVVVLALLFQITRLFFYFANWEQFSDLSGVDIFRIFAAGFRFDFSVIGYIDGILILLLLLPGRFKFSRYHRIVVGILFVALNSVLFAANLADSEYFKFTKKRATVFILDLLGFGTTKADATDQLPQFVIEFWHVTLAWIVLTIALVLVWKMRKKLRFEGFYNMRIFTVEILVFLFSLALLVIAARGGFQLKPVSPLNAAEYAGPENAPLVLNTPFTIIKTFGKSKLEKKQYFSDEEADKILVPVHLYKHETGLQKKNIVIIILESFSWEYVGSLSGRKTMTPFLDSLIRKSLSFKTAYASGTQSIEAVPSVLSSIPSLSDTPFITSPYATISYTSLPEILEENGWKTSFFHGGNNGTMGFDAYALSIGIDSVYQRDSYPDEKDYDGRWGIFDEEFLQFTAKKYAHFEQPFFSCIFTLSSHHPYTVPEKYKNQFPETDFPIEKSVRYADYALKRFFETTSKSAWFKNTLFVLTADHTGPAREEYFKNSVGRFRIPLIFYSPDGSIKPHTNNRTTVSQIDIFPSILDFLQYQKSFFSLGTSIFREERAKFSCNFLNEQYQIIENEQILFFADDKPVSAYNLRTDSLLHNNIIKTETYQSGKPTKLLKSLIQNFNNRIISDKFDIKK